MLGLSFPKAWKQISAWSCFIILSIMFIVSIITKGRLLANAHDSDKDNFPNFFRSCKGLIAMDCFLSFTMIPMAIYILLKPGNKLMLIFNVLASAMLLCRFVLSLVFATDPNEEFNSMQRKKILEKYKRDVGDLDALNSWYAAYEYELACVIIINLFWLLGMFFIFMYVRQELYDRENELTKQIEVKQVETTNNEMLDTEK